MSIQSMEETYVKDCTEVEAEEYLRVKGSFITHLIFL